MGPVGFCCLQLVMLNLLQQCCLSLLVNQGSTTSIVYLLLCNTVQLGIGLRSNAAAAAQLMEENLLGTARFAVVRDDFDQNQARPAANGFQCQLLFSCLPD